MPPEFLKVIIITMIRFLEYQVTPGENVPQGLPQQSLPVLSPIWRGPALVLEYPDGEVHTLVGWRQETGAACEVQVFWTRHEPRGPAVCLAIGGDGGLRNLGGPAQEGEFPQGVAFLALAESMIPREILTRIGPAPPPEPLLLM